MAILQTGTTEEKLRYFETLSESYKTLWEDEAKKRDDLQAVYDQRLADIAHYKSEFERKKTECSQLIGQVNFWKKTANELAEKVGWVKDEGL